jgi:hypothetical protein
MVTLIHRRWRCSRYETSVTVYTASAQKTVVLIDPVLWDWRKLHNEELHNLYFSPNMIKSRRMRWAGHIARMGETRNAYRILVWNPEGKRPLGRTIRRWVDNIKMDLKRDRMGWYGLDRNGSG